MLQDRNETINTQNGVSPVPVSWAQLISPSQTDVKPTQPQVKSEKTLPAISYVTEAEVNTVPK